MLKVELHAHTSDDPVDIIPHDTCALIARAAALGYQALAVTLHDRQLDLAPFSAFASSHGVTLIPGMERTIEGKHVLLLNFPRDAAQAVETFADLRALRALDSRGLVVAPHPFFPASCCLGALARQHQDLFDAVEYNGMFTRALNFNAQGEAWARECGLPMVGNGDVHRLEQLGTTWSLVDAAPDPAAICAAVREGRVQVVKHPHSVVDAARIMGSLFAADIRREVQRLGSGFRWTGSGARGLRARVRDASIADHRLR